MLMWDIFTNVAYFCYVKGHMVSDRHQVYFCCTNIYLADSIGIYKCVKFIMALFDDLVDKKVDASTSLLAHPFIKQSKKKHSYNLQTPHEYCRD